MVESNNEFNQEELANSAIAYGIELIIAIGKRVRNSILDYSLGAAILGLIPVYGLWVPEVRLLLLTLLNFKMIINIGRYWGYHKNQDLLVIIGSILSILSSFALAIFTWLTIFALGLFIPFVDSLARAVAYGILTWSIGHGVSRYYYSPQILDTKALQKALQFQRSQKQRHLRK